MDGVDCARAALEGEDCAGEDDEGIVRGCAKLEEVFRGVGACECPLKRGLGGSRSTGGFGASSPLMAAFEFDCEGVCEAEAVCGVLAGAASVIGMSIGADGVCTLLASVCMGPTGADL